MPVYSAYGLGIRTPLPLDELVPDARSVDIDVRFGDVMADMPAQPPPGRVCFPISTQDGYLFWEGIAAFRLRHGREIVVEPEAGTQWETLSPYLTGPALGLLLQQRGLLVLHASVVAVEAGAVAFAGAVGAGKSTLAAAFHSRGAALLADDVTAIEFPDGIPTVRAGFPQVKLCPDAAERLCHGSVGRARKVPGTDKAAYPARREFGLKPLCIRRVYILAAGREPSIERLTRGTMAVELLRHSFGLTKYAGDLAADHVYSCAKVASRTQVARLYRPKDLSRLDDVVDCVRRDLDIAPGSASR